MVAPVRKEAVAVAGGAQIETVDMLDARSAQCAFGRRPKVELVAFAHDVISERLAERRRNFVAHLVAAGTDARTYHSCQLGCADRSDAGGHDAGEQAAPAGMKDLD